jgi:endonuclease YncB( thermonuclease family)
MGGGGGAITGQFWTLGMLVGLIALPGADAVAQTRSPVPTACKAEVFADGWVATVIDGRSFALEDGREVRLSGIEVPMPEAMASPGGRETPGWRPGTHSRRSSAARTWSCARSVAWPPTATAAISLLHM